MEQVGYDMYCKLLEEVIREMQGKGTLQETSEEQDIQIDISVSSYIPDSYIENGSQKIEMYQDIALCRTEEDIQNVIDEMIDRYGAMPKEVENLLEVARIKELAKKAHIVKISQKKDGIVFTYDISRARKDVAQGINAEEMGENKEKREVPMKMDTIEDRNPERNIPEERGIDLNKLLKIYGNRIRFSPGTQNYVTLKMIEGKQTEEEILKEIKSYLENQ